MKELFNAALHNDTQTIKEYLRFGNVNVVDETNSSLLHYATMGNAIEVANLLIDNYINLNIQNSNGETPLFLAVSKGEVGIIKLLLRHNADSKITNNSNESVYFKAILKGRKDILELLEDETEIAYELVTKRDENILFYALYASNNKMFFQMARKYPALLNQKNYLKMNLLMMAIKYDNYEVCQYLLDQDINIYALDIENNNSIFYAARYASCDILRLILDKKPIIAGKNKDGFDIFMLSELNEHPTQILLDTYNNSYDYVLYKRTYPFHIAIVERNYDLLECISVDIKKRDINGLLIIDLIKLVDDKMINKIFNT